MRRCPRSAGICTCRCSPAPPGFWRRCGGGHTREDYLDADRPRPRRHPGHRAVDRYDRRLSWRDGGRLRGHAVAHGAGPLSQHVLVQVLAAARTRSPSSAFKTTWRRGRRRGGSWRCRRCRGRFRESCTGRRSARVEAVLVDSRSRRRDWELSGRTSGNTVVNFAGAARVDRADRPDPDYRRESQQPEAARRRGLLDTTGSRA